MATFSTEVQTLVDTILSEYEKIEDVNELRATNIFIIGIAEDRLQKRFFNSTFNDERIPRSKAETAKEKPSLEKGKIVEEHNNSQGSSS
jgi:hypothetical protein